MPHVKMMLAPLCLQVINLCSLPLLELTNIKTGVTGACSLKNVSARQLGAGVRILATHPIYILGILQLGTLVPIAQVYLSLLVS